MTLITVPSGLKIIDSSFRLQTAVAESENSFSFNSQTYDWGGTRWEGEITIRPYTYEQAAEIRAFLVALKGKSNTFLYGDPDYLAFGGRGSFAGAPLVNGSSQTGTTLNVDGFTFSQTNIVRAGDYLQLGSGASSELYMIIADANSNGSGQAIISLNRPLRTSPADNSAVVFTGAKGVFRLSENMVEWNTNASGIGQITIAFKEAL